MSDAVRGGNKYLVSSENYAEQTDTDKIRDFIQNGFESGTDGDTNWSGGDLLLHGTERWWVYGNNTEGTKTAQVRANPTAGFLLFLIRNDGTSGSTVGRTVQVLLQK